MAGETELFQRNLDAWVDFLKDHKARGVAPLIDAARSSPPDLTGDAFERDDAGRIINLKKGDQPLYPKAGDVFAAEQIDHYFADPDRIHTDAVKYGSLALRGKQFWVDLTRVRSELCSKPPLALPKKDVGYSFVFGLGLGYHIRDVIKRTHSQHVLVYEPSEAFFLASLEAMDWEAVFAAVEAEGSELYICVGDTPQEFALAAELMVEKYGPTLLDGSYAYVHDTRWAVTEARALLNTALPSYFHTKGFFDDELLMMKNSYRNFSKRDFFFIDRSVPKQQTVPVFIVGSGPSLDRDLAAIKRYKDQALVYSCGSSLGVLLKNGIRPDLHVENENTPQLVSNLRDFEAEYGLQGITLTASSTVNTEALELFDETWLYFRDYLSPSFLLNPGITPVLGAAPLVSNAAFSVAVTLGFREIYLFGCDCGRREAAGHHAEGAVYYEDGYDNFLPGEGLDLLDREFDRRVPANFGGEALTTWYLDMSRTAMAMLQRVAKTQLVNCSDGARIEGARPMASSALRLTGPRFDRLRLKAGLKNDRLKAYSRGQVLEEVDLAGTIGDVRQLADRFRDAMAQARSQDGCYKSFLARIQRLREETPKDQAGPFYLLSASLYSFIRAGAYLGSRIDEAEAYDIFREIFFDAYEEAVLAMLSDAEDHLKVMEAGGGPLPEFWTPDGADLGEQLVPRDLLGRRAAEQSS